MIKKTRSALLRIPRSGKQTILIAFDFIALSFAVWAAYSLRYGVFFVPDDIQYLIMIAAPICAIPVFIRFGLYRSVIRYLPEKAFLTIANAVIFSTLLWVVVLFLLEFLKIGGIPRSVPLIYSVLAILIIGGSRFGAKYFLWTPSHKKYSSQVVIYGAGEAGSQLVRALHKEGDKFVAGFIDDNVDLQGREVAGVRVNSPDRLSHLIETMGVKEVILSMPRINSSRRQEIISSLSHHQIKIRALPALSSLASGQYIISQVREINIDDILGRSTVPANPELLSQMLENRVVLISGAGGSIGSELSRLVTKWKARKIILFEANEFALYQIDRDLRKRCNIQIIPILGSITDKTLVNRVLKQNSVQVVFHAAAHKHVPLVEANALEGIRNNVFGTKILTHACLENAVENFVLISSDKAVRPTNVMGATKRWAEMIVSDCANIANKNNTKQKFCFVRFGNVLGSNGSVVPLFKEQIAAGGPLTVTDEVMTRYFMSIHEAAELIVQAGALSKGGDTFLLEMGEPILIKDLAINMIRLAGLSMKTDENPNGDIGISIIGRRPGEKTHEELFYDPKSAKVTRQPKILRSNHVDHTKRGLNSELKKLNTAFEDENENLARRILFDFIKENETQDIGEKIISISSAKNL